MRFIRFAATAALLLQLPCLAMAADVTTETMRSSAANSLSCANGIKSVTTGVDPAKFSDQFKQALLTGNGLDGLATAERSLYSGLQRASTSCDVSFSAFRLLMKDIGPLMASGNLPTADFKAEFDKMVAAYNTANAAQAEATKVPGFASVFYRASSNK